MGAKHPRQIDGPLAIDGQAEQIDTLYTRFSNGLTRILDAVGALIDVFIVGLAVREQEQETKTGALPRQQGR